jgi:hypothetical protein
MKATGMFDSKVFVWSEQIQLRSVQVSSSNTIARLDLPAGFS